MRYHVPTPNINNFLGVFPPFPHLAGLIDPREAFEATKPSTMSSLWCHRKGLLSDQTRPGAEAMRCCGCSFQGGILLEEMPFFEIRQLHRLTSGGFLDFFLHDTFVASILPVAPILNIAKRPYRQMQGANICLKASARSKHSTVRRQLPTGLEISFIKNLMTPHAPQI